MDEKNLKQKDLADMLGISKAAVSQWNNEGTNISIDSLFFMSKLFHVTVDELLAGKRVGESLEDKWKRVYDINEDAVRKALIDGNKERALKSFAVLSNANERFFDLFVKKFDGTLSVIEQKELAYLRQFYSITLPAYWGEHNVFGKDCKNVDDKIINKIKENVRIYSKENIMWELKKIYKITTYGVSIDENWTIIPVDSYYDNVCEDPIEYLKTDRDIFFAIYNVLPPIDKDHFLNSEFALRGGSDFSYELIKRGGNILYTPENFNRINYDYKDLEDVEGEPVSVKALDEAHEIIFNFYRDYSRLTYNQYCKLINQDKMKLIGMEEKYKEKDPIRYWEYVKHNVVLI